MLRVTCCVIGLLAMMSLAFLRQTAVAYPLAQAPVVSPDAVTTPGLLPTVTPTPATTAQPAAAESRSYVVQPGDTLFAVALEIGVDLEDMACVVAPDFTPEQPLVIGNRLEIPPPGTLCHAVQPGETLAAIATRYGLPPEQIYNLPWNGLAAKPLDATQPLPLLHLRIPLTPTPSHRPADAPAVLASADDFLGFMLKQPVNTSPFVALAVGGPGRATKGEAGPLPANWPYGSGHFAWPLHGWLSQGYRYDHRAVDIAAPAGTLVTAADRGVVIRAGWNNQGYGQFVIIDHNIDYVTLYAHLSEIYVVEGQVVAQGQAIGQVGSTGNSTGPHLHFEIRDFGRLTNPLELLGR